MARGTIFLQCGDEIIFPIRSRVDYAFRVFAAIYDYEVAENGEAAEFCCLYGNARGKFLGKKTVRIPARYRLRSKSAPIPKLKHLRYAQENFYLVHGVDSVGGSPDWLGEIFEWLSSSLELPISGKDGVGRIPFSRSVFIRQEISALKPHASLLMAWLENVLQNSNEVESLPKAMSPAAGVEHMVVCSHDVDFYFTNRCGALLRFGKNIGISLTQYRDPSYFMTSSRMILDLLRGD